MVDMQVTGTKEAFISMISQSGFAKSYGFDKTLVSQWKSGKRVPALDKMEEVLILAGASVVQEKVWEVNPDEPGFAVDITYKADGSIE